MWVPEPPPPSLNLMVESTILQCESIGLSVMTDVETHPPHSQRACNGEYDSLTDPHAVIPRKLSVHVNSRKGRRYPDTQRASPSVHVLTYRTYRWKSRRPCLCCREPPSNAGEGRLIRPAVAVTCRHARVAPDTSTAPLLERCR